MGARSPRALVLDSGTLIAFERNERAIRVLIELAVWHGGALHAPAGVVGHVWRDGAKQARLARLLGSGAVQIQVLDRDEAQAAGILCGESGTSDVIDASVALVGRRHGARIVTTDARDLRRLDPGLDLVEC